MKKGSVVQGCIAKIMMVFLGVWMSLSAMGSEAYRSHVVYFQAEQIKLSAKGLAELEELAQELQEDLELIKKIEIQAFSDSSGDRDKNRILSKLRVGQIATHLKSHQIPESLIQAQGRGIHPIKKRRAEIRIQYKSLDEDIAP